MAKTDSIHGAVTGKVGPVNYYRLRGSEKLFVRANANINKSARKHHSRYERTRQENMEFKGCVKTAIQIVNAVFPIKSLGDFNSFGQLVRICKFIQQADPLLPKGRRPVLISRSHSLLNGFSFNKYNTFETLVKSPVSMSIERQSGIAQVVIPPMRAGIHLGNPAEQPYYRFVCTLSKVCDLFLPENSHFYETLNQENPAYKKQFTPWLNWNDPFPAAEMIIHLPNWVDLPHRTLIAGIGIEFGKQIPGGQIEFVKYACAGKIWVTG